MSLSLPSFPLNLVVYPGEKLRLYIFELRYRQLIRECLEHETTFVIPTVLDKSIAELATEVKIVSLDKDFPSGEMNITTEGIGRVRIREFQTVAAGKLYPASFIERLDTTEEAVPELQLEVFEMTRELHHLLGVADKLPESPDDLRAFELGHHVGMNLRQEYNLLTLEGERERLIAIKNHIKKILPIVIETERLKSRAKLNGHFKNLIPPHF